MARAVAEARSSAAPVEASPQIRRSAARPPRRTARVSARYRSPYSRRSSAGSVSVSPRACPAPSTVTRLTGSACGDSVATRAWPASWTATVASSPGASGLACRVPSSTRSRAAAKSAAVRVVRPARTAVTAASLTRPARSAPENPGVAAATWSRSASGPRFLPRAWAARMAARSARPGSGTMTSRSNRPGRRSAGSRASGRLVAASTTTPPDSSNPSISASSWFRVCSRSSLPPKPPGRGGRRGRRSRR